MGASALGVLAALTLVLAADTALAERDEATEELHKIELALEELRSRDMNDEAHERAQELEKRAHKLRDMASKRNQEEWVKDLRAKLERINKGIAEFEGQDLSAEGTPDRWEPLERLPATRAEIVGALERGRGGADHRGRDERVRANLSEFDHAIRKLEEQDLSAERTPDRWDQLQNLRKRREKLSAELDHGSERGRRGNDGDELTERLHGIELRVLHMREEIGDREWTDENHAALQRMEDMAAELRGAMRKQRGRPQARQGEKQMRRGGEQERRKEKRVQRSLRVFRLEHAD
ncbi:MAG: hypothetical protein ABGY41_11295, partial [Candidatus Poribacteria bacterium]